jgi:hypothetical protein
VSGNSILHTSDSSFESGRPQVRRPRASRLLGRVVRSLQGHRADPRRDRRRICGRVKIAKLNIDENRQTPLKYGVRGIPTLILFKNGAPEAQQVGLVAKSKLAALLDSTCEGLSRQPGPRGGGGGGGATGRRAGTAIAATASSRKACRRTTSSRAANSTSSPRRSWPPPGGP